METESKAPLPARKLRDAFAHGLLPGMAALAIRAACSRAGLAQRLYDASRDGNALAAKLLLAAGADPRALDRNCRNALLAAAETGQARCVELLLAHCDPDARDVCGDSALTVAARNGHADCVELLLPRSRADRLNFSGCTALMVAAHRGRADCVALLLPHSPLEPTDLHDGLTAMALAVRKGHQGCARLIAAEPARREAQAIAEALGEHGPQDPTPRKIRI